MFQNVLEEARARRDALRRQHEQDRQAAEASLKRPQDYRKALEEAYQSPDAKVVQRLELVSLGELVDLQGLRPTRGRGAGTEGAGALARLLDSLARHALQARRHDQVPNQIVVHTSVELLAETLGVPTSTIWRWTQLLEAEGYCQARTHYTTAPNRHGERTTMVDGTLYAVRLKVGHPARVRYDDLKRQYRNLDADRRDRHTARHARYLMAKYTEEIAKSPGVLDGKNKLHGSDSPVTQKWKKIVHEWAVTPGSFSDPLASPDPCNFGREEPKTVHDVVQRLALLQTVRSVERSALINFFSGVLARELNDVHSRRWYAKLLWNALGEELSGWPGLEILGAQLHRLEADRREWRGLRCPAALLAARLR
ncbi:hypothetical protein [Deinococcus petrolearius]|uniref:Replication protein n=1 Tax=Deinococcus petrolearius TaxID=1751295 RepID=A0ABW1DIY3_9DEIO